MTVGDFEDLLQEFEEALATEQGGDTGDDDEANDITDRRERLLRYVTRLELEATSRPCSVEFEYDLHETVRIPALSCEGLVTGRLECIRGVRYEVAWWMNGSRRTEYLYGWELARVERPAKERP